MLLVISIVGGATNLNKCVYLWSDGVLRKVGGWLRIPDATTIARILKGLSERHVNQLEEFVHTVRGIVWTKALKSGVSRVGAWCTHVVDIDSTVVTVFGTQEGAAKGYNPHKRGALSYHPLLAFSATTKEILQGWFRTGNAYTSNGILEFVKQLLESMPKHWRIIFRGDSGFFVGELLELLDKLGHGYIIKVKMRQEWHPIRRQDGWEQCEFQYQATGWSCPRIFVAVRHRVSDEDKPNKDLFSNSKEGAKYEYFCYVSTEPLNPWDTHKAYGKRATSETWIDEGKNQMGLAQMRTNDFIAKPRYFRQRSLHIIQYVGWHCLVVISNY
jgi:hypothetical protein